MNQCERHDSGLIYKNMKIITHNVNIRWMRQARFSQIRLDWSETCPSLTDLDIGPDIEERVQPMGLKVRCELGKFTKYIHSLHQVKYVRLASPSSTQRVISGFVHNQAKKTRPVMGRPRASKWSPNSATWTCLGSSFNLQAALVMIMAQ